MCVRVGHFVNDRAATFCPPSLGMPWWGETQADWDDGVGECLHMGTQGCGWGGAERGFPEASNTEPQKVTGMG